MNPVFMHLLQDYPTSKQLEWEIVKLLRDTVGIMDLEPLTGGRMMIGQQTQAAGEV
jgi:hypothetical protein